MSRRPKRRFRKAEDSARKKVREVESRGNHQNETAKKTVFGAVAILLSLCISLAASELVVRRIVEGSWPAVFSGLLEGVPYSELRTGQWVISDPDLGYRLNPDHPETNSLGLRNPEISALKPSGTKRILVIGDSVAATANGFVDLLRDRLRDRVEVINGAVPGYTVYQERLYLERDLIQLAPDLVILQYCTNDHHKFLHRFDPKAQLLLTEQARWVMVSDDNDPLSWLPHNSYLAFRLRVALLRLQRKKKSPYPWDNSLDFAPAWRDESWGEYREHFDAIRRVVSNGGGRLAVVMAPLASQFDPGMLRYDPDYVLKPQLKLAALCEKASVPVLDLHRVFFKQRPWELYRGDGIHFNERGHTVAGDALFSFLESNGLVPE